MNRPALIQHIHSKKSVLCVGLDPVFDKIPQHLRDEEDPIFEFNKAIIDATAPYCVAFKPNTAFYEAYGLTGIESLDKTMHYLHANYSQHFIIADAKRGDIGNTGAMYAQAFFKKWNADAVTVSPYMGRDSVEPFLSHPGKWAIVLGLTSNPGADDFQRMNTSSGPLYVEVMKKVASWGTPDNLMFVVGATQSEHLKTLRTLFPFHFFLIPGIGAQGGSLKTVWSQGVSPDIGLLVNASRSICYQSAGIDFAKAAATEAKRMADEMSNYF